MSGEPFSRHVIDIDDFDFAGDIGEGSFGTLKRLHDHHTSDDIAVKSYDRISKPGCDWETLFLHEIETLCKLNHPCIVSLFGFSMPTESAPARVATKFVDGYSLAEVIMSNPE
jgi:serine/threonine protein kinase